MKEMFNFILNIFKREETDQEYLTRHFDQNPRLYDEYVSVLEKAATCKEGRTYYITIGNRVFGRKRISAWEVSKRLKQ